MTWAGHTPIYDRDGDRVGWITNGGGAGTIFVPLPASFTSDPMNPSAVGVQIVYNDGGDPIGIFGGRGFQRGGLRNGTELDPAVRQQIIDEAIANVSYTTMPTTPAPSDTQD